MKLTPMSETQARAICTWSYTPPYNIYDMGPWDLVIERGWTIGDPEVRAREMLAVVDDEDLLLAYVRLSEDQGRWMLGIGLHPQQCGRGLGLAATALAVREHQERAPGASLWLEVRDWNLRAIRCYEKAGFEVVDTVERVTGIGPGTFVVMRRVPPPD